MHRLRRVHESLSISLYRGYTEREEKSSFFASSSARRTHINRAHDARARNRSRRVLSHSSLVFLHFITGTDRACRRECRREYRDCLYIRRHVTRTCRRCEIKRVARRRRASPSGRWMHLAPGRGDLFDIYSRALTLIKTTACRHSLFPRSFFPPRVLFIFLLRSRALCSDATAGMCELQHAAKDIAIEDDVIIC